MFASVDIIWLKIIQPLKHIEPFFAQVSMNVCRVRLAVQNCTDSMYNIKNSWTGIHLKNHYCRLAMIALCLLMVCVYTVSNLGLWASMNQDTLWFSESHIDLNTMAADWTVRWLLGFSGWQVWELGLCCSWWTPCFCIPFNTTASIWARTASRAGQPARHYCCSLHGQKDATKLTTTKLHVLVCLVPKAEQMHIWCTTLGSQLKS